MKIVVSHTDSREVELFLLCKPYSKNSITLEFWVKTVTCFHERCITDMDSEICVEISIGFQLMSLLV